MSLIKVTPLELFVDSFLRTHKKSRIGLVHLEDAVILINKKLGLVCCDPEHTPAPLHSRQYSQFTTTVRQLLHNMVKAGNVKSLQRTKAKIQLVIDGCNCP